jgi:putative ABC transport system permease protein
MSRLLLEITESFRIAFAQIRANKLRSALTALGVIIGIVAVSLMGTAIKGIDAGVDRSLSGFGDDLLYVTKWPWSDRQEWWRYRNRKPIKVEYAQKINEWVAEHPGGAIKRAIPAAERMSSVVRGEYRVNMIYTLGTTEDYARAIRSDMTAGRFFSDLEAEAGRNVHFFRTSRRLDAPSVFAARIWRWSAWPHGRAVSWAFGAGTRWSCCR